MSASPAASPMVARSASLRSRQLAPHATGRPQGKLARAPPHLLPEPRRHPAPRGGSEYLLPHRRSLGQWGQSSAHQRGVPFPALPSSGGGVAADALRTQTGRSAASMSASSAASPMVARSASLRSRQLAPHATGRPQGKLARAPPHLLPEPRRHPAPRGGEGRKRGPGRGGRKRGPGRGGRKRVRGGEGRKRVRGGEGRKRVRGGEGRKRVRGGEGRKGGERRTRGRTGRKGPDGPNRNPYEQEPTSAWANPALGREGRGPPGDRTDQRVRSKVGWGRLYFCSSAHQVKNTVAMPAQRMSPPPTFMMSPAMT